MNRVVDEFLASHVAAARGTTLCRHVLLERRFCDVCGGIRDCDVKGGNMSESEYL